MLSFPLQLTMNMFANIEKEISKQYGELFPGDWKEKHFFPLLFCILPPRFHNGRTQNFVSLDHLPTKTCWTLTAALATVFKAKPFCWLLMLERIPHIGLRWLLVIILFKNLGSLRLKKIVFWEEFYVYRHFVTLFIIYGGVKDMKLSVNWIKSKFYWHFLVIIIALCLM